MKKFGFFTFLVYLTFFFARSTAANTFELLILYTGNTLGELKPCGCAKEEDQGGIERRATYLKEIRKGQKNTLLLDTGDNFKEPTMQGKIKANYLMKSMGKMFYDGVILGDKDLVYGKRFLSRIRRIPWVATNLEMLLEPPVPAYRIKRFLNGFSVAVFGLADPNLFYIGNSTGIHIAKPEEALQKAMEKLRKTNNPDLIILLTHMRKGPALKLLNIKGVDIVVNGHLEKATDPIDMSPVQKNGKIFVQAAPRGQKVGELRVSINPQKNKTFEQRMVKLDSHIKFDFEMVKLYEEYNKKIEEIFFASVAEKKTRAKKAVYATVMRCKQCHGEAHDIWSRSGHAGAYETLKKVNKAFDPECLTCHTVGFNRPGGFISNSDSPELANVQCEVCHGPGLVHIQVPKKGWSQKARSVCGQCHVKNHSPRFNFTDYWSRIQH